MHRPFCLILFPALVYASSPFVAMPLSEQLPLIARVGQSYSWTPSANTFGGSDGVISYTALGLPSWLSFNPSTLTVSGTPAAEDEGNLKVTITASDGTSSASSSFRLCVTSHPSPVLDLPISVQFRDPSPSISSAFVLASGSSLATKNPALRVPPGGWSFSIGIEGKTYHSDYPLCYDMRLSDGGHLPPWLKFDRSGYTLDGVTPPKADGANPIILPLKFIVSDQCGYSAESLPFDLIIADHELSSMMPSLATINVTAASLFKINLRTLDYFSGLLVDGVPIHLSDIADLDIDITQHNNLVEYDRGSRVLYGNLTKGDLRPGQKFDIPAKVTTNFNQSLSGNYTIAIVPSYFTTNTFTPLEVKPGHLFSFSSSRYFAVPALQDSVELSVTFNPAEAANWLSFDPSSALLTGTIPSRFSGPCSVTFEAYSNVKHSASYAYLPILVSPIDGVASDIDSRRPRKISPTAHARLLLATGIILGCLGGLSVLGCSLAVLRKCATIGDTAAIGEEARRAWNAKDRKWYGVPSPNTSLENQGGYGWTKLTGSNGDKPTLPPLETKSPYTCGPHYGTIGLGQHGAPERKAIDNMPPSGRVMKKEFISMIKKTARQVSDRCRYHTTNHPIIGKPTLISPSKSDDVHLPPNIPSSQFESTFSLGSTTTGIYSAPRQRADFGPPKSPAQVHLQSEGRSQQLFSSKHSLALGTPQRESLAKGQTQLLRPRLVPFTSANRVPTPQDQSSESLVSNIDAVKARRVPSQKAKVWRSDLSETASRELVEGGSNDELCMGIQFVQAFGSCRGEGSTVSMLTTTTMHGRSSFSSLESSHQGHGVWRRVIVRMGEQFKYRIRIAGHYSSPTREVHYTLKTADGAPLPQFLKHDLDLINGCIEIYGIPGPQDPGSVDIGVYIDEDCIARTTIDIVEKA